MQFFRRLQDIRAISFDLDDTLYDNRPVIENAEQWMVDHMRDRYLASAMYDRAWWLQLKHELQRADPSLHDDVSRCRLMMLEVGLQRGGMAESQAKQEAKQVFAEFLEVRSQVVVPAESIEVLKQLSRHFPLVVITNGNVLLERIGLDGHFKHVLKAGNGRKMKPAPDMFRLMAAQLKLRPQQILHVGDDVTTDIFGAIRNGYQAAWINNQGQDWRTLHTLPHLMLQDIRDLLTLLPEAEHR
ncbi:MAG: HAD family hydrolase [Tolumonas sp.]|jgi:putative hydrolase of the HAD superfamily|nr:MAG: HAD family hydrolase [Tolumonas sp.]